MFDCMYYSHIFISEQMLRNGTVVASGQGPWPVQRDHATTGTIQEVPSG